MDKQEYLKRKARQLYHAVDLLDAAAILDGAEQKRYLDSAWFIVQSLDWPLKLASQSLATADRTLPNSLEYWHSVQDKCNELLNNT